jgi:hypothetical protein
MVNYHTGRLYKYLIAIAVLFFWSGKISGQHAGQVGIGLNTGYQRESFNWSIAGNLQGKSPNVFSELVWKDLRSISSALEVRWSVWNRFMLQAGFSRSFIVSGRVTDTDFSGDNRTSPTFHAVLKSNRGNTGKWSGGLGYRFTGDERYTIIPYAGYAIHGQSLFLHDDAALNSTYKTEWKGPYARLETTLFLTKKIYAQSVFAYYQVNYEAKANWNLVESFQHPVSFKHQARGYGLEGEVRFGVRLGARFTVCAIASTFRWSTGAGTDILYLQTGDIVKTKLNNADHTGSGIKLGVTYQ